jgi:RHS repeat-associated protein
MVYFKANRICFDLLSLGGAAGVSGPGMPGRSTDDFAYGYDQDSDVLYRLNLVDAAMSELYQYNNVNELISFARGTLNSTHTAIVGTASRSQSWSPDSLGNFDSVTTNGSTQTRTTNQQNEITSISGSGTVDYDANGNLTADGSGNTYVYDAWNRLVAVQNSGTTVAGYSYDGLGRRITEVHGTDTRELYYSGDNVVAEWYDGLVQAYNVWSPVASNTLVVRSQARFDNGVLNDRFLVQQDANGNVTALVKTDGTVVERYAYDPYGAVTVLNPNFTVGSVSVLTGPYGFQGMRTDWLTSLNFATYRVYDPALQRWLQTDPIGLIAGNNDYEFVNDTPTNETDPSGLQCGYPPVYYPPIIVYHPPIIVPRMPRADEPPGNGAPPPSQVPSVPGRPRIIYYQPPIIPPRFFLPQPSQGFPGRWFPGEPIIIDDPISGITTGYLPVYPIGPVQGGVWGLSPPNGTRNPYSGGPIIIIPLPIPRTPPPPPPPRWP